MSEQKLRILVVDDDAEVVAYLVEQLRDDGHQASGTTEPSEAIARVEAAAYDLVISDVEMPKQRGFELMKAIHAKRPGQLVLLITAFGSIGTAVAAFHAGACDFVTKPFRYEDLQLAIRRAVRERGMRREIVRLRAALADHDTGIVAHSPAMRRVVELCTRAAASDANVLLTGESGVGKGMLARLVHDRSARAAQPFVQVNCASLPAALAEAELFGVRRGAYTNAVESRQGLFAAAGGGTLFLDEIGEMPLEVQSKLLQVIESGKVRAVGDTDETKVDVRLVTATNRSLEGMVAEQRFRSDLFFRIDVVRVHIPPLRERPEDLRPLIDVLLERACQRSGRELVGVTEDAMRWMLAHHWPGNVRELANVIERAVVLSEHDSLVLDDVAPREPPASDAGFLERAARRGATLAEVEDAYIRAALDFCGGNRSEAARLLGIDRRTLYRRLGDET